MLLTIPALHFLMLLIFKYFFTCLQSARLKSAIFICENLHQNFLKNINPLHFVFIYIKKYVSLYILFLYIYIHKWWCKISFMLQKISVSNVVISFICERIRYCTTSWSCKYINLWVFCIGPSKLCTLWSFPTRELAVFEQNKKQFSKLKEKGFGASLTVDLVTELFNKERKGTSGSY